MKREYSGATTEGRGVLYYVTDPMCSWCWGFAPLFEMLREKLQPEVKLQYVMGGLAPDSDEPMPTEMQGYLQSTWQQVAATTGAEFNHEFWEKCQPRRSTYPACRAAIASGLQGKLPEMFAALQRAYYLEARNPSDTSTHLALAQEQGLDTDRFANDLASAHVEELLQNDFALRSEFGVRGFPSLILKSKDELHLIVNGWGTFDQVWKQVESILQT